MVTENMSFLSRFLMHVFFHLQYTLATSEFDSNYLYLSDELKKMLFVVTLARLISFSTLAEFHFQHVG